MRNSLLAAAGCRRLDTLLIIGGLAITLCQSSQANPQYSVTDLGSVDQVAEDVVPGLNSKGDVTVWTRTADQTFAPTVISGDKRKVLGRPAGYLNSFAYSLNNKGDAVGWSNTTQNPVDSISTLHACLFTHGKAVDLGTLGGKDSRAYAINDGGLVIGRSDTKDRGQLAFVYSHGKMTPLTPLPTGKGTVAFSVNQAGVVVGASDHTVPGLTLPIVHAVIWRSGKPTDLGALGKNDYSIGYGINDNNDVVGVDNKPDGSDVVLFSGGKITDLDIDGRAFAINDKRQIVGTNELPDPQKPIAFLWDNGKFYNLNDCIPASANIRLESAYKINERGQIAAVGREQGMMHAVLLTPVDNK
jgi:probable HAF family extracellular repeat protein